MNKEQYLKNLMEQIEDIDEALNSIKIANLNFEENEQEDVVLKKTSSQFRNFVHDCDKFFETWPSTHKTEYQRLRNPDLPDEAWVDELRVFLHKIANE
ncbi:MAG: hypothetical protein HDQ87_09975 [Clostridia bacterium]|nr:hypothetical protein [Clostridia bacterium]